MPAQLEARLRSALQYKRYWASHQGVKAAQQFRYYTQLVRRLEREIAAEKVAA